MVIAGEASGDLHSSGVLREFKRIQPAIRFFGAGGDRMAAEGCQILYHIRDISFLGFSEVIRHLPFIRRMMNRLLFECRQRRPKAVVLVDYPGFNLRFARRLRRDPNLKSIPILYYVSPQVWAWHASRVREIDGLVDHMAVIFEFEVPLYQPTGLKTHFVGHPLLEVARAKQTKEEFRGSLCLSPDASILALLPGSRVQEVRNLFPIFLRTYRRLRKDFLRLQAMVGCSSNLEAGFYRAILERENFSGEEVPLLMGKTYDLLAHSDVALVASGTATLESAIFGTPLVMAYRVSVLTYLIGRRLVKIPDIALVNVVAGKRIVPELVQVEARPERIAAELTVLLNDADRRRDMVEELAKVRQKLGTPGASRKVAQILDAMISGGDEIGPDHH